MRPQATVRTGDLEQALDFLEGLELIMKSFAAEERGLHVPDALLAALQNMDSEGMNWEPLRYQAGVGMGWQYVQENVARLRERLLEGYADAAL